MPDVVSQWTEKTCVIAGVSLRDALDGGEIGRRVFRRLVHDDRAARDIAESSSRDARRRR